MRQLISLNGCNTYKFNVNENNKVFFKSLNVDKDMLNVMEVLLRNINAWLGYLNIPYYRSKADIKIVRKFQDDYFKVKKVWMKLW